MPVVRSKAHRRIAALVVASGAVMLAAACGGGSGSDSGAGAAPAAGGRNSAAFTAYADCLKKNGVTITVPSGGPRVRPSGAARPGGTPRPRPSGSAGARRFPGGGFVGKPAGVDDATWQKAQSACASLRPSFGPGDRGGRATGADQAYVNCLRDHGVEMGQGRRPSSADPATRKALDTCKVLRPTAAPAPTS